MNTGTELKWTALLVAALLILPAAGSATEYRVYLFRGTVVDTDSRPLEGVKLSLKHRKNLRVWETETDKKGEYRFVGLPNGVYEVTVSKEGYQTHTQTWSYEAFHQEMKRVQHPPLVLLSNNQVERMETSEVVKNHFEEAAALLSQGDVDGALVSALAILEVRPDDPNGLYIAGMCYLEKDQVDEAISALTRTVELLPDYAPAWIRLGMARQKKGEIDEAIAAYDRALELEPESMAPLYNAGAMLYNAGRPGDALPYFERALAVKDDDFGVLEMAGYSALQSEHYARALEFFERARALTDDAERIAVLDELITALKAQVENTAAEG